MLFPVETSRIKDDSLINFEQRKIILKCYWKCENTAEEQRQFRSEFQTDPPTRLAITQIRDNFEADGSVQNVQEKRSSKTTNIDKPDKARKIAGNVSQKSKKICAASVLCGRYFKIVFLMHFETLSKEKLHSKIIPC